MNYLFIIALSFFCWTCGFILSSNLISLAVPKTDLWDIRNRTVSIFHGLFLIIAPIPELIDNIPFGSDISTSQEIILSVSIGYFLYDTICIYCYGIYDKAIMFHHLFSMSIEIIVLLSKAGAIEAIYFCFLFELTNPLLHTKELLRLTGQRNTKAYLCIEMSYFIAFFCFRLLFGVPSLVLTLKNEKIHPVVKTAEICFYILVVYWQIQIFQIMTKRVKEYKERKKLGIELPIFTSIEKLKSY
jgi:hypothetical protein